MVPLIQQVLLEAPTPCKESELTKFKAVTAAAALKMFAELHVSVVFPGISSHEAYAQASADGSRVCIQASWAAVADNARAVKDGSAENCLHYKRQLTMGVIKVIYGVMQSLTAKILAFEYQLQLHRGVANPVLMSTVPISVGFTYVDPPQRVVGDVGCESERILSGVGRFSAKFTKFWKIGHIGMYKIKLHSGNNGEMRRVLYWCELENELALVNKIGGTEPAALSDFQVTINVPHWEKRQLEAENNAEEHPRKTIKVEQVSSPISDWRKAEADMWKLVGDVKKP